MFRLVVFIIIFLVFLAFIVLNLSNTSDLSFGFVTLNDIPVFVSVLCSFMLGMLFSIPLAFAISWNRRKQNKIMDTQTERPPVIDHSTQDEIIKEKSSYGID